MAESWLATTYSYASAVVTSSSELQTAILARMTAVGWTLVSGTTYQSPDPDRWLRLTFTQPDSAKLEISCTDYLGRAPTSRRVGAVGNPSTWGIHANRLGIYVWNSTATGFLFAGVCDHFPRAMTSHTFDVFYGGYHTTANGTSGDTVATFQMLRYDSTFTATASICLFDVGAVAAPPFKTAGGVWKDAPVLCMAQTVNGTVRFCGRMAQAILVKDDFVNGSRLIVPVDAEVSGTFEVSAVSAGNNLKMAVRVG